MLGERATRGRDREMGTVVCWSAVFLFVSGAESLCALPSRMKKYTRVSSRRRCIRLYITGVVEQISPY